MLIKDRLFQVIVFPDRHNHQEINNLIQVENHHIQINEGDHNIGLKEFFKYKNYYSRISLAYHEYHLNKKKDAIFSKFLRKKILPQILSGASSSSKIG